METYSSFSEKKWLNKDDETESSEIVLKELNDKYDAIKPVLKEGDEYVFISMVYIKNTDKVTGILNCRLNQIHKQIRF